MTDDTPNGAPSGNHESNELLDDAFGFSVSSFRLVRDIFAKPNAVITAALARDRSVYASPFRVWFGLLSLQFIVALPFGGMKQVLVASDAQSGAPMIKAITDLGRDPDAVLSLFDQIISFAHIPAVAIATIPGIFILRAFAIEKSLGFSRHLQAHFAFLCVSAIFATLTLPIVFVRPELVNFTAVISWFLLSVTFWRGGPHAYHATRLGAVVKSQAYLLAIGIITLVVISLTYAVALLSAIMVTPPTIVG